MHFLERERATLHEFLPGLDEELAKIPLLEMERPGNPALKLFREHGGPGLLLPVRYGGKGATPLQAARMFRALASRSPSLAVAACMHNSELRPLVEANALDPDEGQPRLLASIARRNLYVAAGFAEGKSGKDILDSWMKVEPTPQGFRINGSKKPCCLSASMDLLVLNLHIPPCDGRPGGSTVVILTAHTPGLERRPFWNSWILAGAESDELVLRDVMVPKEVAETVVPPAPMDELGIRCFIWFDLLLAASYLGVASALVERTIASGKGTPGERVMLAIEVEGAMAAVEGVAQQMTKVGDQEWARALFMRYAVQEAISRASARAAELLGGIAFMSSSEVAYLLAACRPLAFHPGSRLSASAGLDHYLAGGPLFPVEIPKPSQGVPGPHCST
jgi:alkylation response protein AidB-like acyl-CoA dehydrogenase